jgi:hypothetical protein
MRHRSNIGLSVTILLPLLIVSIFVSSGRAGEGLHQTKDGELIQDMLKNSYFVESSSAKTFDLSLFSSIFVNDQRGGELSPSTIEFIRSVSGDYISESFGYLDYKIAYYTWWKAGALKLETLQARANLENRELTEDELKTLIDDHGRVAMPRSQSSNTNIALRFISIEIEGEKAIVIYDDGLRTNQAILLKIDDNWYIAGNKILSLHP